MDGAGRFAECREICRRCSDASSFPIQAVCQIKLTTVNKYGLLLRKTSPAAVGFSNSELGGKQSGRNPKIQLRDGGKRCLRRSGLRRFHGQRRFNRAAHVLRPPNEAARLVEQQCRHGSLSVLDSELGTGTLWAHSIGDNCLFTFHDLRLNEPVQLIEFPEEYVCITSMTESSAKLCPIESRYLKERNTISFHQGSVPRSSFLVRGAPLLLHLLHAARFLRNSWRTHGF